MSPLRPAKKQGAGDLKKWVSRRGVMVMKYPSANGPVRVNHHLFMLGTWVPGKFGQLIFGHWPMLKCNIPNAQVKEDQSVM